eukprot:Skav200017  [mRNA]  locus=scaffold2535:37130:38212:+ [translate_table: standard]
MSALQLSASKQELSKADSSRQGACVEGNLLPNIYVLGAQKSATSTLSWALMNGAGVTLSTKVLKSWKGGAIWGKESLIVARSLSHYAQENMTEPAVQKRFAGEWRSLFSSCEDFPNSSNVGEFTAENLAFTDPAFAKDWPTLSVAREELFERETPLLGFDLPPVLRYSYGDHFARVRFFVLLREPVSRVQSQLYQFQKNHCKREPLAADIPFDVTQHLREELRAFVEDHVVGYKIWHGLYGRHLLEWFSYWPSSQFLVVPYKYLSSETDTVCQSVQQHLALDFDCSQLRKRYNNDGASHPTLEQEVPEDLLRRVNQALQIEFKLLVDVLVNNSKSVVMPALKSQGDATPADVEQWLVRGW